MLSAQERMKFAGLLDGGWLGEGGSPGTRLRQQREVGPVWHDEEGLGCLERTLSNGAMVFWPADRFLGAEP